MNIKKVLKQLNGLIDNLSIAGELNAEEEESFAEIEEYLEHYVNEKESIGQPIPIYPISYINCDDIKTAIGVDWRECGVLEDAENGSFVRFYLTDEARENLLNLKAYEEDYGTEESLQKVWNDIKLFEYLYHRYGHVVSDKILIYCWW